MKKHVVYESDSYLVKNNHKGDIQFYEKLPGKMTLIMTIDADEAVHLADALYSLLENPLD